MQRALSLAKYLPGCGYEVHILKATNAGGPVYDPALLQQVPDVVRVHEAFTPEVPFAIRQRLWAKLSGTGKKTTVGNAAGGKRRSLRTLITGAIKRVLCPEPEIVWTPFALRKARRIIRTHGIEHVLVTVPPFSALVIGTRLKREFPHLHLISDFRDEWLTFYLKDFDFQNSDYTRRRAEVIEREAVEASTLVVAVNRSSRDTIRRRYPNEPDEKFIVIPNGYDPAVFEKSTPRQHGSDRMLVTHVGTVYKTASPRFFLDAFEALPRAVRDRIEVRFVGRISESERASLEQRENVNVVGFVPQAEALKYMTQTDYLLLTMENEISVPGKLYEYLAAGKPVLAITPPGSEVDQLMAETGAGDCAAPDNSGELQAMIMRAFSAWAEGSAGSGRDTHAIRRYERPRLVRAYAEAIEHATAALIKTGASV